MVIPPCMCVLSERKMYKVKDFCEVMISPIPCDQTFRVPQLLFEIGRALYDALHLAPTQRTFAVARGHSGLQAVPVENVAALRREHGRAVLRGGPLLLLHAAHADRAFVTLDISEDLGVLINILVRLVIIMIKQDPLVMLVDLRTSREMSSFSTASTRGDLATRGLGPNDRVGEGVRCEKQSNIPRTSHVGGGSRTQDPPHMFPTHRATSPPPHL